MSADAQARVEDVMLTLRERLDTAFNPVIGERKVLFTVILAEAGKIDPGEHFPTSHISNVDNFEDQIAMAKAFVTKCEDFIADQKGGD